MGIKRLTNLNIADHIDYVVLSPGVGFYMNAPGIVTDGCSAVTRFAVTAPSLKFQDGQCENVSAAIKLSKKMPPADSDKPWFSDLTSQTTIAVSNIRFRDYVADSLEGSLHAKNDVVTFDRLIVKRKENEFAVSGDYRLSK